HLASTCVDARISRGIVAPLNFARLNAQAGEAAGDGTARTGFGSAVSHADLGDEFGSIDECDGRAGRAGKTSGFLKKPLKVAEELAGEVWNYLSYSRVTGYRSHG